MTNGLPSDVLRFGGHIDSGVARCLHFGLRQDEGLLFAQNAAPACKSHQVQRLLARFDAAEA